MLNNIYCIPDVKKAGPKKRLYWGGVFFMHVSFRKEIFFTKLLCLINFFLHGFIHHATKRLTVHLGLSFTTRMQNENKEKHFPCKFEKYLYLTFAFEIKLFMFF